MEERNDKVVLSRSPTIIHTPWYNLEKVHNNPPLEVGSAAKAVYSNIPISPIDLRFPHFLQARENIDEK